ncbi:MAG TPA: 23S rRNA (pseudouridine(1915)-N(3))-methyltransferase RlmH [Campylobacterales bacterium]|jgi:23S rRNA (pseudouridine1915-N3)-methyltransferase|nr:23S rRNA (pseudouridine(1915)-N(3))-methyltransferase RlmH [Campylobacterales bacterium]HHC11345.1 23S rRNA (pseudouridine(1915)-N(3))-methyltransferase RlmH [Campylobacterales bacterium]
MKINIYIIDKKSKDNLYAPLIEHYKKISKPFAKVEIFEIFTKDISKAHEISTEASQKSYTIALNKYLSNGYNVALDPSSKEVDSYIFSDLFKDRGVVNLFIGGAFGFERGFLNKCNKTISFGKITMSHKLTKVVLMEQIFRGLTILNNHPYHK